MRKIVLALMLMVIVSSLPLTVEPRAVAAVQVDYYVSPTGDDTNPGTLAQPFKTLEKARQQVRSVNTSMTSDIIVNMLGGTYAINSTVQFDSLDSGYNGHRIIYRNYNSEVPVLSGGERVTAAWSADNGNIVKANIGAGRDFRQLYIGDSRGVRARTPNEGSYYTMPTEKQTDGFNLPLGQLAGLTNLQDKVEVSVIIEWMHKRLRINNTYDADGYTRAVINTIEWNDIKNEPQGARNYNGREYWLENAYEFLDSPGEWYYNSDTGMLYYWPQSEEDMSTAEVIMPNTNTLVSLNGTFDNPVRNMTFEGLQFKYTNWTRPNAYGFVDVQANTLIPSPPNDNTDAQYRHNQKKDRVDAAMNVLSSQNIIVKDNTFSDLGGTGLTYNNGGSDNLIQGNLIQDASGSGIEIGNDAYKPLDSRMTPRNYILFNNHVDNIGIDYLGSVGITVLYADNFLIQNNLITNVPYSGMSVGWGWSAGDVVSLPHRVTITKNRVENFMQKTHDGAAIYLPNPTFGANVTENYVYNYTTDRSASAALYLDGSGAYSDNRNNVFQLVSGLDGAYVFQTSGTTTHDIRLYNTYSNIGGYAGISAGRNVEADVFHTDLNDPEAVAIIQASGLTNDPLPTLAEETSTSATVDNSDAGFTTDAGGWTTSTARSGSYNGNYASTEGGSDKWAKWTPTITSAGEYNVYIRYPTGTDGVQYAPIGIYYNGGSNSYTKFRYDQQLSGLNNEWLFVGTYYMKEGNDNYVKMTADNTGLYTADAVRFIKLDRTGSKLMNDSNTPLLAENFEDGDSSGWTTEAGSWSIGTDAGRPVGEQTMLEDTDSTSLAEGLVTSGDTAWTNYVYRAKVKIGSGTNPAAGLVFRYTNANNYYLLRLNKNAQKLELYKKTSGAYTLLQQAYTPISPNVWYALRTEVRGNRMKAYIGNQKLIDYTNAMNQLTTGKIGIRSYDDTSCVDDVNVELLDEFLYDDFEDGDMTGWTIGTGTWEVSANSSRPIGEQNIIRNTNGSTNSEALVYAGDASWTDYSYQATVKNGTGNSPSAGLVVRYANMNNYYMLRLNKGTQRLQLYKKVGGTFTLLQQTAVTITTDTWNKLKAEVRGNRIKGYVDGVELIDFTNALGELASGKIGLRSFEDTPSVDDIRVVRLNEFLDDDFEDQDSLGWTTVKGSWEVGYASTSPGGGTFVLKNTQPMQNTEEIIYAGSSSWTNYMYEGRIRLESDASSGLLFRYVDSNNYYMLRLNEKLQKLQLYKNVAGVLTLLQEKTVEIQDSTWYTLQVSVVNNQIYGYVDGVAGIVFANPNVELLTGKIGIRSYDDTVQADSLKVIPL
jgi:hypothetical protein